MNIKRMEIAGTLITTFEVLIFIFNYLSQNICKIEEKYEKGNT